MSLLPTAAELELTARVRAFAEAKLRPHARRIDEEGVFRRESVAELAQAGILGGPIGATWGGQGWTPPMLAMAHEELGAVCGNTRGFVAVHTCLVAQNLERHGTEEQKRAWLTRLVRGEAIGAFALTEEEAGSDVGALRTRAERRGDRWVLTGKKIWITNGGIADLITVFATEDPALNTKGITGFLVEGNARGLRREKMPGKELGHRGSDHAALLLDGVEVPDSAVFGTRKQGFKVAMDGLFHGRISVAAGAVGCHRAALEACLQFARSRQQFGKTLGEFQMVQERIADMATELEAARLLVRRCALMMEAGTCTPVELAMAKLYATEAAFRAAEQAVLLHGGRGYSSAYPVERLMRDVMGMRIYEGTTLIQKTIIARKLLG